MLIREKDDKFVNPFCASIFSLKKYFDMMCGKNIYDLFYDEIREITFHA